MLAVLLLLPLLGGQTEWAGCSRVEKKAVTKGEKGASRYSPCV